MLIHPIGRKSHDRCRIPAALIVVLLGMTMASSSIAQVGATRDTLEDGGIVFTYEDSNDENLTVEERISALNARLLKNPTDAKSWNDLGILHAQRAENEIARDAFIHAVQASPQNGDYHRNLGMIFFRLGMADMAVAEFEAYRRFDTMGGRDYWRLIGQAQVRSGQIDAARQTFHDGLDAVGPDLDTEGFRLVLSLNKLEADADNTQAVQDLLAQYTPAAVRFLKFNPRHETDGHSQARNIVNNRVAQLVNDAKLMEQSQMWAEAAHLFTEAYDLAPERDDLLPRLVDVHIASGKTVKGRVVARLAREDHPDKAGSWIASGRVYEVDNRLEDAVESYKKAFILDPAIVDLEVAIGNLLIRLGRDKEANAFLRKGVSSANAKPEVVYNYAVSLIREKKYHAAVASLRSVVNERPQMFAAWSALAQCLRATKQFSAAIDPYQKALALQPDAKLAYNLGYCAMKAKHHDTAIEAYGQALVMDPEFIEARYNLSLTYMNAKRYEEAVTSFDLMLELEPDSYRVYYSQGLSNYYLGRHEEALECYDLAYEQKETVNLLNNIGLVYDQLGDKKEARSYYKSAKKLKDGK